MKLHQTMMLGLGIAAGVLSSATAQLPVSRQAGILPVQLTAGQPQLISIPFITEPVARAVVADDDIAGQVTLASGSFGSLTPAEYTLVPVTGGVEGTAFPVTGFPGGAVVQASGLPGVLAEDVDEVLLVKNHTLDSLFPSGSPFTSGGTSGSADIIYLYSGGVVRGYYYDNNGTPAGPGGVPAANPTPRWIQTGTLGSNGGTVIGYNSGMLVIPVATKLAAFQGIVRSGDQVVGYPAGPSIISLPFRSSTTGVQTLDTLVTSDGLLLKDFVNQGGTSGSADILYLYSGGVARGYYYDNNGTPAGPGGVPAADPTPRWIQTGTVGSAGATPISRTDAILLIGAAADSIRFAEQFAN